jgi:putative hydrolase of the HAD superfamily
VPGAFELVARLRASGVTCGLATNQDLDRALFMDEELGYGGRFDHSFYSCRLGVKKPSPEYFRHALSTVKLAPSAVLFLDDHQVNVEAAQLVGINAELITPTTDLQSVIRNYGLLTLG